MGLDLLKAVAFLSNTTVWRSESEREDQKPYWKLEKRPHLVINKLIIYKFFKDFANQRKKTNRAAVFNHRPIRDMLKTSASISGSSGSQVFRTTTGIQSRPDVFGSRSIMNFLTNLGGPGILWSFRLVLDRKAGKDICESSRLEILEKFSVNNFALSDAGDNTSEYL